MINSKELLKHTNNFCILFVEDHDELRKNTIEILKNFFKEVHSAADGKEALVMFKEYHKKNSKYYDIILSDIQMPRLNGIELTQELYQLNPTQTVIILSAFDDSHYLLPLINLGIEQFIKKPIDYQELLKVLLNTAKKLEQPKNEEQKDPLLKIQLDSNFIFNKENDSLCNKTENIYLTKYEIIFLQLLTNKIGKIYSNDDIVANYIAHNENLDAQNIRKLVSKLRKKLPKNSLESIYGVGYRIMQYYIE